MHFIQFKSPVPTVKDGASGTYHDNLLIERNWQKIGDQKIEWASVFFIYLYLFFNYLRLEEETVCLTEREPTKAFWPCGPSSMSFSSFV